MMSQSTYGMKIFSDDYYKLLYIYRSKILSRTYSPVILAQKMAQPLTNYLM